jgi:hypothetical protein
MDLSGSYTFDAPKAEVWQALMDPEVLAKVMPGCEKLEQVGENQYQAELKIKVGPVQGNFSGNIELLDINEPDSYRMKVDGKGPAGFMKGDGEVKLEAQGQTTLMHYNGTAQVGGRIASVGQRLLDSSAKALTKQSLESLHKQILARWQATGPTAAATAAETGSPPAGAGPVTAMAREAEAPSQTGFAVGVAKNLLAELLPPERRPLAIGLALVVIVVILYFVL